MNLVAIEDINPFNDLYEFKVYEYDYEINIGNVDLFVCDLKVIISRVNEAFITRIGKIIQVTALVSNINSKYNSVELEDSIKSVVLDEIYEENVNENNIEVIIIRS